MKPNHKTVLCFGTFDLLHLGHLHYFQQAKRYGDYLIVVIARDKTKRNQKKPTLFTEQERLRLIQGLKIVDRAVLGHVHDHFKIIRQVKPDIICLGYDHSLSEKTLAEKLKVSHLHPLIKRISPYRTRTQKSNLIKKKVLGRK